MQYSCQSTTRLKIFFESTVHRNILYPCFEICIFLFRFDVLITLFNSEAFKIKLFDLYVFM